MAGVRKSFGRKAVLNSLCLEVPWGQVVAVLGPNGSGKSTLLRILATLTQPDGGEARVAGLDVESRGARVRRLIGVVTHEPMHYDGMTAAENLALHARLFGLDDREGRVAAVAERMGIESFLGERAGSLSHGMQRRLAIARALLHDPPVLLLDEPESGLDREALSRVRGVIEAARERGMTVVKTTHNLEWGVRLADRAVILRRGRVEYDSGPGGADAGAVGDAYADLHGGAG